MILKIDNISKTYQQPGAGTLEVLKPNALEINKGDTIAITGHSGSGKTTLLSLIAGLDKPDSGSVILDGEDITHFNEDELARYRAQKIGMIFQQFHLMPHLSAEENVKLPLEIMKANDIEYKTNMMLEKVGLTNRKHHLPGQLSGGENQRVAIARALVINPAILLADEPTGNLDNTTGDSIANLLFNLVESEQMTLVLVTHNMELANRCSTVKRLENGLLK